MTLNLDTLQVESFPTTSQFVVAPVTSDTGKYGPHSYCWICEPSDPTVPSCDGPCDAIA